MSAAQRPGADAGLYLLVAIFIVVVILTVLYFQGAA